ncbi:hypothetical protein CC1G_08941 [Coprinopsis cinerea okayama7|uniref:Uncharacterized protein n=1 Tax=Coprinopsis cinerea (strain Okayama-7 / 130 / ATCC MYA-4618 / FGSC 9003) TaxID=240176 RepID=A8P4N5_COPC7|nr:hypothetical protein CC1G_08941 [Coprinopsis cinerea okayama7\|eukprot:XP_001838777.1 hypothetical protein CC1G_08941 [Coprinopsis cinerea okayama7\
MRSPKAYFIPFILTLLSTTIPSVSSEDVTLYHMWLPGQDIPPDVTLSFTPAVSYTPVSVDQAGATHYHGNPLPVGKVELSAVPEPDTTRWITVTDAPTVTYYHAVKADATEIVKVVASAPISALDDEIALSDKSTCVQDEANPELYVCVFEQVVPEGFGGEAEERYNTFTMTETGTKYPWYTVSDVEQFNVAKPTPGGSEGADDEDGATGKVGVGTVGVVGIVGAVVVALALL